MTAAITSIPNPTWTANARNYCFHARTSVPTSGSLWLARAAIFFVSVAGTVTKTHTGLELAHTSQTTGERVDFLLMDAAGNSEWAAPVTTTVGTGYTLSYYVDATSGSDTNGGTGPGDAFQTYSKVNSEIRTNAAPGDEVVVYWSGETHTITSPTGGYVWRSFTSSTPATGSDLGIRVTWKATSGTATLRVTGTVSAVVDLVGAVGSAFVLGAGMKLQGDYTTGGASTTAYGVIWRATTVGAEGPNVTFLDCEVSGFESVFVASSPAIALSYVDSGEFDWLQAENCTFGSTSAYHIHWQGGRYYGFSNCTFGDSKGDSTGTSLRMAQHHYLSVTDCTFDRSAGSYKGNVIRVNGGEASASWDYCKFMSFSGVRGRDVTEFFEFDGAGASTDNAVQDIWVDGCVADINATGAQFFASFGDFGGTTHQMDTTRVRFSNNACRMGGVNCMFRFTAAADSASVGKVNSLAFDGNTIWQANPQGFSAWSQIFLQATGHVDNYVDGSLYMRSNYAHCAGTTGGGSHALCWMYGSLTPAKFAASERNIMTSAAVGALFRWTDLIDLAAWQAASGNTLDLDSFQTGSATVDMTDVSAATFDPTPSTGSGLQVGEGLAGILYADANRYLRSATTPTAGSREYNPSGSVPDPDFGAATTSLVRRRGLALTLGLR